jgi:hypothetical protein
MKKKTFDAVVWMRTRRAKIDEEDQGLSWPEKREKTRRLLANDPLWLRLKNQVIERVVTPSVAVLESRGQYNAKRIK